MNKYQEAIDKLRSLLGKIAFLFGYKEDKLPLETSEELNKLQELVDKVSYYKELEDKATPKKPKINHYGNCRGIKIICPNGCGIQLNGLGEDGESKFYTHDYCPKCGQKIDWGKDD